MISGAEVMSKKIILCCDGTGNQHGENNSNVVKLYRVLVLAPGLQVGYYHPGVGTLGAKNALTSIGKAWTRFRGLAFGYGVSENIADAYEFLMHCYQPDDSVYIFGFSRGAYTARALCGMLEMFGLLSTGNEGLIPYIVRLFKSSKHDKFKEAAGFRKTFCTDCKPHFLGVWDTVISVGWILDPIGLKPWRLPYTSELGDVAVVRHAVSIDERRAFFRQNLVRENSIDGRSIKQVWFAGVHSDVGGSYPELQSGLSKIAFQWMVREAMSAGLLVDKNELALLLGSGPRYAPPQANAVMHNSMTPRWWLGEFWPKRTLVRVSPPDQEPTQFRPTLRMNWFRRRFIPEGARIHESVVKRKAVVPQYQPKNLPNPIPPDQIESEPPPVPPFVSWDSTHLEVGDRFSVEIASKVKWNITPLAVRAGTKYRFEASGTWHDASIVSGPAGYASPRLLFRGLEWLRRVPKANWFSLICVVDQDMSTAFAMRTKDCEARVNRKIIVERTITKDGFLNCFANDLPFMYWNNSGAVKLTVTRLAQQ
jgi:uncharacterized protein (DUF2235 family)